MESLAVFVFQRKVTLIPNLRITANISDFEEQASSPGWRGKNRGIENGNILFIFIFFVPKREKCLQMWLLVAKSTENKNTNV